MKIAAWLIAAILAALTGFMLFTAGWEAPPIDTEQSGYRGTGMAEVINPRTEQSLRQEQLADVPEAPPLPASTGGPTAGDVYQNVQVLGDLSIQQFNRLMQGITEWVSPEEGCGYCHNLNNLAEDSVYTKVVSRRMIQMTQNINADWKNHVAETGVTCYTCHRGKNLPEYGWYNTDPDAQAVAGMAGWRGGGQNMANADVGLSSLPEDPFSKYLEDRQEIRVLGQTALPDGGEASSIQETEYSYGLMIHMSTSLGVNCTYCHNSRAFGQWEQSTPQRTSAWHGIRMAQSLNSDYVAPLSDVLPPKRLGPTGEGQKVNCGTCHQGVNKPLYGLMMAQEYPSLYGSSNMAQTQDDADNDQETPAAAVAQMDASENTVSDENQIRSAGAEAGSAPR